MRWAVLVAVSKAQSCVAPLRMRSWRQRTMRRRRASSMWQQRLRLAPTRRDRCQLLRYVMIDIGQRTRRTLSAAVDSESVCAPPARWQATSSIKDHALVHEFTPISDISQSWTAKVYTSILCCGIIHQCDDGDVLVKVSFLQYSTGTLTSAAVQFLSSATFEYIAQFAELHVVLFFCSYTLLVTDDFWEYIQLKLNWNLRLCRTSVTFLCFDMALLTNFESLIYNDCLLLSNLNF